MKNLSKVWHFNYITVKNEYLITYLQRLANCMFDLKGKVQVLYNVLYRCLHSFVACDLFHCSTIKCPSTVSQSDNQMTMLLRYA